MKRILFCFVIFGLLLPITSCRELPTASALAQGFLDAYGSFGVLFSPEIEEGERGYVRDGFFETLYGDYLGSVSDYALILHSDGEHVSECAVLIAVSQYDAVLLTDAMYTRLDLIRSVASDDSSLEGAFVMRGGLLVVMCAVADNTRAEKIWKKLM